MSENRDRDADRGTCQNLWTQFQKEIVIPCCIFFIFVKQIYLIMTPLIINDNNSVGTHHVIRIATIHDEISNFCSKNLDSSNKQETQSPEMQHTDGEIDFLFLQDLYHQEIKDFWNKIARYEKEKSKQTNDYHWNQTE